MVIYLNSDNAGNTWNKKQYLLAADRRLGLGIFKDLKDASEQAECILNIEPFDFHPGTKWTGLWEIDLLLDRGQTNESNWTVADDIFIAISSLPGRLERFRPKTTLLFQACDPTFNKRYREIEHKYDFVLCGTVSDAHNERRRVLEIMKNKFSFCGFDNGRPPNDYSQILNQARVQFIRSMNTSVGVGEIAQRFFECLAIGPVLTNWVPDLLQTGLVEDEDYMAYRNDEEMIAKMELLLKPEIGEKIAKNGRRKALTYHTYDHRAVTISQIVNEHLVP